MPYFDPPRPVISAHWSYVTVPKYPMLVIAIVLSPSQVAHAGREAGNSADQTLLRVAGRDPDLRCDPQPRIRCRVDADLADDVRDVHVPDLDRDGVAKVVRVREPEPRRLPQLRLE